MKQEELKLLAEWYGYEWYGERTTHLDKNKNDIFCWNSHYKKDDEIIWEKDWRPDKDSNQLDMLEDKMIEELMKNGNWWVNIRYSRKEIDVNNYEMKYFISHQVNRDQLRDFRTMTNGEGKTKNEARLSAILNYVKGLK